MFIRYGVLLAVTAIANGHRATGDCERNSNRAGLVRRGKRPHGKDKRHAVAEKSQDNALELPAKLNGVDMGAMQALQIEARREERHRDAKQNKANANGRAVIQPQSADARAKPAVCKRAQGSEEKRAANHGGNRLAATLCSGKALHL